MRVASLALVPVLLVAGTARAQDVLSCQLAPGWTQSEAIHQYTADNLYDYKDGGAEGYLIYGFTGMKSITCKSGANTLTIDVSEMNDADAAYGLFATNRDPRLPIAKIGMGGQVQPLSATFAKGKCYVEIVENAADPGHKVIDAYGVPLSGTGPVKYAQRDTFLISPAGKIVKVWTGVNPNTHSDDVLAEIATEKK
jgi:hypothetical protein